VQNDVVNYFMNIDRRTACSMSSCSQAWPFV